tara:strand:+ start:442 stop:780 length:339 start_codon:yes stop_codon:yes gene_type:complete
MNRFKILSEKVASKELLRTNRFINYTNSLSQAAKQQPGFISSNSYFKGNLNNEEQNSLTMVTISEWTSSDDWEQWFQSSERKSISHQYQGIIKEERFHRIFKRKEIEDIFLL